MFGGKRNKQTANCYTVACASGSPISNWRKTQTSQIHFITSVPATHRGSTPISPLPADLPTGLDYSGSAGVRILQPTKAGRLRQLFRPSGCAAAQQNIVLYGLDADKHYRITDFDGNFDFTESGAVLTEKGFSVSLPQDGSCSVFTIRAAQ